MASHNFSFEGGEELRSIGATWLVSYAYYDHVDKTHKNWTKVSTAKMRIRRYERTRDYHEIWLKYVESMEDANLSKNTIGLTPQETKAMAKKVLQNMSRV